MIINLFSKILNILELIAFIYILLFEYISGLKDVNETVYYINELGLLNNTIIFLL